MDSVGCRMGGDGRLRRGAPATAGLLCRRRHHQTERSARVRHRIARRVLCVEHPSRRARHGDQLPRLQRVAFFSKCRWATWRVQLSASITYGDTQARTTAPQVSGPGSTHMAISVLSLSALRPNVGQRATPLRAAALRGSALNLAGQGFGTVRGVRDCCELGGAVALEPRVEVLQVLDDFRASHSIVG